MSKQILCLDFDGVCNTYASGWRGEAEIPDPPVPWLFEFLSEASQVFDIVIHSSRAAWSEGLDAMVGWFMDWSPFPSAIPPMSVKGKIMFFFPKGRCATIVITAIKPPAFVTLDDRAVTFIGTWPSVEELKGFKPWHVLKKLE